MKKIFFTCLVMLSLFWLFSFISYRSDKTNYLADKAEAALTQNVTLTSTVLSYGALTITSGGTIDFGNITPGTDSCNASGTVLSAITNAANGYTLGVHDGDATNSAMSGALAKIPDMIGTIAAPAQWATGSTTGLGVSLWTGTSTLDAQWAVGTTACSYTNKYAGVPAASTVAHTVTGYHAGADSSSWGWKVNVLNTQPTGIYTGNVTFTMTSVLS